MNTNILTEGLHIATVTSYASMRFAADDNGFVKTPRVKINFETEDKHMVSYVGFLTPKATPFVRHALLNLGYKPEDRETFRDKVKGRKAQIKVEHEVGTDGVTRARVSFINKVPAYTLDTSEEFYSFMDEQDEEAGDVI